MRARAKKPAANNRRPTIANSLFPGGRWVWAGEILLEDDLGREVVHRAAGGATRGPRTPSGLVGGQELSLEIYLQAQGAQLGREDLGAARSRTDGTIGESWQTEDKTAHTEALGGVREKPCRRLRAAVRDHLEGRDDAGEAVAHRQTHSPPAGIDAEIPHRPIVRGARPDPLQYALSHPFPATGDRRHQLRRIHMIDNDIVILSAVRTPIGSFLGALSTVPAPRLGAVAIVGALERASVAPEQVEQVMMGNVLQAGLGQAPARQAGIYAGIPYEAGAVTVHKVCGSGLKAVMLAGNDIRCGEYDLAVAGGMENMSLAPYLLPKGRTGYRMGTGEVLDHMVFDGLWDPYDDKHMGSCAETCVRHYKMTREAQDAFATRSYERAQKAAEDGTFAAEIVPVDVKGRKGAVTTVDRDEEPFRANLEKMPKLRPAFDPEGSVTAANASKINDGAAAVVVCSAARAQELGLKPVARIVAQTSVAQEPEWFTTAPVGAIRKVLDRAGMSLDEIDLFEINEAFAAVVLAAVEELDLPLDKVNVHGGAVALGHPIGASGARILTTLLNALEVSDRRFGCAAICIGGGEAAAMVVERLA